MAPTAHRLLVGRRVDDGRSFADFGRCRSEGRLGRATIIDRGITPDHKAVPVRRDRALEPLSAAVALPPGRPQTLRAHTPGAERQLVAFWLNVPSFVVFTDLNRLTGSSAGVTATRIRARSEGTAVLDDREIRSAFGDPCFKPDGARRGEEDAECSRPAAVRCVGDTEARCE